MPLVPACVWPILESVSKEDKEIISVEGEFDARQ